MSIAAHTGKNFWVFIIFGRISYENWWSTNLRKNNPFIFCNKSALSSGYFVHVGVFIPCCFPVLGSHYALHYMSLFANKKYTSWMITVQISICRMMFFYLEFVNIIWIVLTKLFQAVGSLLNGFVAIRCHCFAIERVHAAHVRFVKHSPIMAAELLQLIRYMIVDIAITNIARQDGASNTVSVEPMVFTYTVRCTIVMGALYATSFTISLSCRNRRLCFPWLDDAFAWLQAGKTVQVQLVILMYKSTSACDTEGA